MKKFLLRKDCGVRNTKGRINMLSPVIMTFIIAFLSLGSAFAQSDAGISAIPQPGGAFGADTQEVWVTLMNYSGSSLSTATIHWSIDGVEQAPYSWTGDLAAGDTVSVLVGTFDFTGKRPMAPFRIHAWTTDPNGGTDNNQSNDLIFVDVAPYLSVNRYTVGGTDPDFTDVYGIQSYLMAGGFNVSGDISFSIRPGTYDAQMLFENIGNDTNNLIFESESMDPSSVILTYTIDDTSNNYIWRINNTNNITIRNLTFNVAESDGDNPENPERFGGHIFEIIGNSGNINISNNVFTGIMDAPRTPAYAIIYAADNDSATHVFFNNTFYYGSMAVYEDGTGNPGLNVNITTNTIMHFSWMALRMLNIDSASITLNTITAGATEEMAAASTGIYSTNGTYIAGNTISGLVGSMTDDTEAAIKVVHSNTEVMDSVIIEDNIINNSINVHGIYVIAENAVIRNNDVTINATEQADRGAVTVSNSGSSANPALIASNSLNAVNAWGINLENSFAKVYGNIIIATRDTSTIADSITVNTAGIRTEGSSGYIANNFISGRNASGVVAGTSTGLALYYNTIASWAMNAPTLSITGGNNTIMRNVIVNLDSGLALSGSGITQGMLLSNENNFFSSGVNVASWNGTNYADLAGFTNVSMTDAASVSVSVPFVSDNDLRLQSVVEGMFASQPLQLDSLLNEEIQRFDFDREERLVYYFGADVINPEVSIVSQEPRAIIDCEGSIGHQIAVVVESSATEAQYQWEMNGMPIEGETGPILAFDTLRYSHSGVYRARVWGLGGPDTLYTDKVLVYALRPTEIVDSVVSKESILGNSVDFEVKVHAAEVFLDTLVNLVQIQWFRGDSALHDDDRIAGSGSSILSIRDIQPSDYGDDYYVVVTSICGSDTSDRFSITVPPTIDILEQPGDIVVCEGDTARFRVNATVSNGDTNIVYQWRFNGQDITDDTLRTGATTNEFVFSNVTPADTGEFEVIVRLGSRPEIADTSVRVRLFVNTSPVFNATLQDTIILEEGDTLSLNLAASGSEPIGYQWFNNNSPVTNAGDTTLTIDSITALKGGIYYLQAVNNCGEVYSDTVFVIVNPKIIEGIDDAASSGFVLKQNTPNPFGDVTTISYILPIASNIKLTVTDVYGREVAVLVNGTMDTGYHEIKFHSADYRLSAGVYYYILHANGRTETNKMVIAR